MYHLQCKKNKYKAFKLTIDLDMMSLDLSPFSQERSTLPFLWWLCWHSSSLSEVRCSYLKSYVHRSVNIWLNNKQCQYHAKMLLLVCLIANVLCENMKIKNFVFNWFNNPSVWTVVIHFMWIWYFENDF